jgi:hypothetical protein
MGARELRPDVELAAVEVEVRPDQAQQLGDPQAGVDRRGDQGAIARRAGDQEADDLVAAQDTLSARDRMGTLPASNLSTGFWAIQPLRNAKRTMLWSVASAPATVFSDFPTARSRVIRSATSSTPRARIRRGPNLGSRCLSRW